MFYYSVLRQIAHVLLERFEKEKIKFSTTKDSIPRLVVWAGRTKEATDKVFDSLESKPLDIEFIGLLHSIQKYEQTGHLYRGFMILEEGDTGSDNMAKCTNRIVDHCDVVKRPVVWMFTGMGAQWIGMGTSLMQIDVFRETIYKCHEILEPYGLDLISIVTSSDETTFDNIIHSFVGIAAIQIAIVDILRLLDMPFDYCIGHSVGELGCAYADGTLTAEQMIKAAYARGLVSVQTKIILGSMAAVGRSYEEIEYMVPESIEIACHNR